MIFVVISERHSAGATNRTVRIIVTCVDCEMNFIH